jgi:hypothetical protein
MHVFVRGVKIELKNSDYIISLIDEINKGNPMKVQDLLAILDPSWGKEIGFYILNLLYKNHGITIIK